MSVLSPKADIVSYAADCDVIVCYGAEKGHSVSARWRGSEVDTIFGFEKESDALQVDQRRSRKRGLIENQTSRKNLGS
jgi:hypothetical protein